MENVSSKRETLHENSCRTNDNQKIDIDIKIVQNAKARTKFSLSRTILALLWEHSNPVSRRHPKAQTVDASRAKVDWSGHLRSPQSNPVSQRLQTAIASPIGSLLFFPPKRIRRPASWVPKRDWKDSKLGDSLDSNRPQQYQPGKTGELCRAEHLLTVCDNSRGFQEPLQSDASDLQVDWAERDRDRFPGRRLRQHQPAEPHHCHDIR